MARNATEIERVVARTLRESLEKLQHTTDEANQAIGDLVSACSSARPSNTLPHILRAQTAAATLAATLDVLSRFITSAMHTWNQGEASQEADPVPSVDAKIKTASTFTAPKPVRQSPAFDSSPELEPAPAAVDEALHAVASETAALEQASLVEPLSLQEPVVQQAAEIIPQVVPQIVPQVAPPQAASQAPQAVLERPVFEVTSLPVDQQELHRRANRVAKVSMQDIKMLRPADVRTGKENNDLCERLRDDIERAHKEYERRFNAILGHPVDYFYAWMVEILGEGDPRALGKYPYPSTIARRQ